MLIEAARHLRSPVKILIAGRAGKAYYQSLIDQYRLQNRVALIGRFNDQEKYTLYARALAVFSPFDEDYGLHYPGGHALPQSLLLPVWTQVDP